MLLLLHHVSAEAFHLHSLDLKQLQLEKWQNRFQKTQHSTKCFWQGRLSSCFHNIQGLKNRWFLNPTQSPEWMWAWYFSAKPQKIGCFFILQLLIVWVGFSIPLVSKHCAYGLVGFRQEKDTWWRWGKSWLGFKSINQSIMGEDGPTSCEK